VAPDPAWRGRWAPVRSGVTALERGGLLNTPESVSGCLVSVITPAYNAEKFIRETILSVQNQDHQDWEMLVIDDVSSDSTRQIVRELAVSENSGPAAARNTGLDRARSRYVAFLDSDDLWLPQKLSTQLAFMKKHDAALTYTGYGIIDENGDPVGQAVRVPSSLDYHALLKNTIIGCLTVMVDRQKTGPLKMLSLPQHEDLTLWYSILKRGMNAHGIQQELARYRIVGGSASRNKIRSALHMWKVYRQVEKLNLPYALWCYGHYAWRAYWKNRV
jgi:teichuronic acid biosynthesis glycosyltransferase TuaG